MIQPTYIYRAALDRVIDGDTYVMQMDLGFGASIKVRARLHGIDVYEHNTVQGQHAIEQVKMLFDRAKEIILQSYKDQRTFERWVCDIYLDGSPLSDLMREYGYEKSKS